MLVVLIISVNLGGACGFWLLKVSKLSQALDLESGQLVSDIFQGVQLLYIIIINNGVTNI